MSRMALDPQQIGVGSYGWSKRLPDPQLTLDPSLPYRVYVLGSGDFTYVGIEHKSKIAARIRDQFAGRGADFPIQHTPEEILGIWTVQHSAAEGYIFALLLSTMTTGCIHRLGGYTQTSATPSLMCKQQYEEQHRLLRNLCFRCGGNHWAKDCKKAVQGVEYKCPSCKERLLISSRCQSVLAGDGSVQPCVVRPMPTAVARSSTNAAPPPQQVRPSFVPVRPEVRTVKRVMPPPVVLRPSKKPKTSEHVGKTLLVGGHKHTAVSWFCGQANPPPKLCKRFREKCKAVELRGGDLRTLAQHGYAALRPKEILPGTKRLSTSWVTTEIRGDKKSILEVRAAGKPLRVSLRQCLFRLSDCEKAAKAKS